MVQAEVEIMVVPPWSKLGTNFDLKMWNDPLIPIVLYIAGWKSFLWPSAKSSTPLKYRILTFLGCFNQHTSKKSRL